jgi:glycosyltransferase involved in cell wall biosynthesis
MTLRIFAYGSIPKDGGTFTFYQNLRPALLRYGWDMRCLTTGEVENDIWDDAFADEGCVRIAPDEADLRKQSMAVVDWCASNNAAVVMPINSRPIINATPHMPAQNRMITRCADSTAAGYLRVTYKQERLARIVATTPRHMEDLPTGYHVPQEKMALIPHGIDLTPYKNLRRDDDEMLRLVFLGRLHQQKGILYIPGILRILETQNIPYHLTIAGSGLHENILRDKLRAENVTFLGTVLHDHVPPVLAKGDILLFLSHDEGFGFALIEGMAAGCVPVASLLPGVSDFIVENSRTGFLKPVGDIEGFAEAIINVHNDRQRLHAMSDAAAQAVRERFSVERMAADYARLLNVVMDEPPTSVPPLPWSSFRPAELDPRRWHSFIPRPVKRLIRQSLYRLRA